MNRNRTLPRLLPEHCCRGYARSPSSNAPPTCVVRCRACCCLSTLLLCCCAPRPACPQQQLSRDCSSCGDVLCLKFCAAFPLPRPPPAGGRLLAVSVVVLVHIASCETSRPPLFFSGRGNDSSSAMGRSMRERKEVGRVGVWWVFCAVAVCVFVCVFPFGSVSRGGHYLFHGSWNFFYVGTSTFQIFHYSWSTAVCTYIQQRLASREEIITHHHYHLIT